LPSNWSGEKRMQGKIPGLPAMDKPSRFSLRQTRFRPRWWSTCFRRRFSVTLADPLVYC